MNTTAEVITGVPLAADLGTTRPRPMIAVLDANPGQTGALRALILELTAHVRREPGCLAFIPYEDHGNPGRFYLYEIYQDLDAFKTHLRTSHVTHFVATVSSLARNASQADQALVNSLGAQAVVRRGDDVADRRSAVPATWAGYRTQNSQAFCRCSL